MNPRYMEFSLKRLILVWTLIQVLQSGLSAAEEAPTNRLYQFPLTSQVSDFRFFHSTPVQVKEMIKTGKALLDVHGILHLKGGVIPESASYAVNEQSTLASFLEPSGIELEKVRGVQLRLIKRDIVIQTPRFFPQRTPKHDRFMNDIIVEPGDIVIITTQEF